MPRTSLQSPLIGIAFVRDGVNPISKQLYEAFREGILHKRFRPGTRLPSTRLMGKELRISRNTVVNAYEQLLAEGYVEAKVGSGTCVARALPEELLYASITEETPKRFPKRGGLSLRGKMLSVPAARPLTTLGVARPLASGLPDCSAFPFKIWAHLMERHWRSPKHSLLSCGDPAGYQPLREAIASYLRLARAVRCETDQVFILNGSQQGLDLVGRLLLDPGDKALIEDPGYPGARISLGAAGASLLRLPVDEMGADIGACKGLTRNVRIAFVTPSHQFPMGVSMTLGRRLALLNWAYRSGGWILEDDYDSEYRYRGNPLPSLQGLDQSGRVIYMGTFSKTVFPSLRLGFLVLPVRLLDAFLRARPAVDGHSPITEQAVLADFIAEGHFARHVRQMRALYRDRQSALVEATERELGGFLEVTVPDGGMHLVGWLPNGTDDTWAAQRAVDHGVHACPVSRCSMRKLKRGGLLLGFAAFTPAQIRDAVEKLAKALCSQGKIRSVRAAGVREQYRCQ